MSSAFGDPPDSGVIASANADGAAIRIARAAAKKATTSRRLGMPWGKAAGSYLCFRQGIHFVRLAPSRPARGSGRRPRDSVGRAERSLAARRVARLDLQLPHPQAAHVELLDAELLDHRTLDGEPADSRPPRRPPHPPRARRGRAPPHAPSKAGSRFSTNAVTPSWKSRVRARACWSSASRSSWPSRSG